MKWNNEILTDLLLGQNFGNKWEATSVSIDTRNLTPGDLFIAIKGKNFDGNNFINEAYNKGAVASIVTDKNLAHSSMPLFLVEDSVYTMQEMAKFVRNKLHYVIGITGSVAKTTTKEILAELLKQNHDIYHNIGNFNNHIGLPFTLINAPEKEIKYTILEMGMSDFKEISLLSHLARPNIVIITNVGSAHIAKLKSQTNIALAKAEIFEGVQKGCTAILNIDDPFYELLKSEASKFPNIERIITFGNNTKANIQFLEVIGNKIKIKAGTKVIKYNLKTTSMHFIYNSIAALATISALDLDLETYANYLENYTLLDGRGKNIHLTLKNGKKIVLIDDSYNASPESMIASLTHHSKYSGRKLAILGDMLELGEQSINMHLKLLPYLENIDIILTVGKMMGNIFHKLAREKQKFHFDNVYEVKSVIEQILEDGDTVLVKGSNSMQLNLLVKYLKDNINEY